MEYFHKSVMLKEILETLDPRPGKKFIDCTLGGAGYTIELAKRVGEKGLVVSFDLDEMAIANAKKRLEEEKLKNVILIRDNFKNLLEIIKEKYGQRAINIFDGVIFDLGLSSAQLSDELRGFSFSKEKSLDMSFSKEIETTKRVNTVEYILNNWTKEKIADILKKYGEEQYARNIALAIVNERREKIIKTPKDLVEIIRRAVPASYKNKKIHFSTKTFQALRIFVNDELGSLELVLPQTLNVLKKGGKLGVVSFHSLEDRIVKQFIKKESIDCHCPKNFPVCRCGHTASLKILTKKPIIPSEEEMIENRRSRSAKLRVAEKI